MNAVVTIKDNSPDQETKYCWDQEVVEEFRSLVKNEKDLKSRLDDVFLLSCLRARKFDFSRTLDLIKKYYGAKKRYPDVFQSIDSPSVEKCLNEKILGYLPASDNMGCAIFLFKFDRWDVTKVKLKDMVPTAMLYADHLLNNHLVQVNGVIVILDLLGISLNHILELNPRLVYLVTTSAMGAYPLRYKQIHYVNITKISYPVFSMMLPFLPYKIRKRIHLHTSPESLQQHIPKMYLPTDLGGMQPSDFSHCSQELRNNEDFFRENQKYWSS